MDILPDEQIVAKVLAGNKHLFGEIVTRYQNKLLRYIRYLTNNSNDSEDIAQETFIKVYRNLNGFNQRLKFSSWVFRIAHNEAINFIKKRSLILIAPDEFYKVENHLFANNQKSSLITEITVKQLLKTLPMKYREPLELYYIEERSYSEISDILRMPIGTVGVRIKRAKALLKNQK